MYEKLASFYDNLMKEDIDYDQWTAYLIKLFQCYNLEAKNILDIGCGTGNLTIPLREKGFMVTGLDRSEEMLCIADNKAFHKNLSIPWLKGDITKIPIPSGYDAIISCCDTLNYILDPKILHNVFGKIYHALKDGGFFTFDLNTIYKYRENYGDHIFTYTSDEICYIWENNYQHNTDIIEYSIDFFVQDEKGSTYSRFVEHHQQRGYSHHEILSALYEIGFKDINGFSFKTTIEPTICDERIQYCARK
ncbi:MAG: class I SAM-dependent DNA methyltransferase [Eubacteriales bacterium]